VDERDRKIKRKKERIDYRLLLLRCDRAWNSAIDAASAAGGNMLERSDKSPDICIANCLGPSIDGVLGAEKRSGIGGGS